MALTTKNSEVSRETYDQTQQFCEQEIAIASEYNKRQAEQIAADYLALYHKTVTTRFAPNDNEEQMVVLDRGPSRYTDWHKAPAGLIVLPRMLYTYATIAYSIRETRGNGADAAMIIAKKLKTNANAPYAYREKLIEAMGMKDVDPSDDDLPPGAGIQEIRDWRSNQALDKFNSLHIDVNSKHPAAAKKISGGRKGRTFVSAD